MECIRSRTRAASPAASRIRAKASLFAIRLAASSAMQEPGEVVLAGGLAGEHEQREDTEELVVV